MQLAEALNRNFKENRIKYLVIVFLLVVGITAGTFTVKNLRETAKQELKDYTLLLLITIKNSEIKYLPIVFFSWLQNTCFYLAVGAFSMLMAGIPVVAALIVFKGFCIGFTAGVLSLCFGSGGFFAIVSAVFLPGIVLLPCFLRAGMLGWDNSIKIIRDRRNPKTAKDRLIFARPFFNSMLKVYIIAQIGVLCESFISPFLLGIT